MNWSKRRLLLRRKSSMFNFLLIEKGYTMKTIIVFFAAVSLTGAAFAQNSAGHDSHHPAGAKAVQASNALTKGEVRKVDKEAGKVTIKHGPLENLGMPAMTMVYRVKDPAMLDRLKAGDKIDFAADKINGAYTVTQVKPAR
jgi:Cu(I)/Ag(I) efflux system protein CusF